MSIQPVKQLWHQRSLMLGRFPVLSDLRLGQGMGTVPKKLEAKIVSNVLGKIRIQRGLILRFHCTIIDLTEREPLLSLLFMLLMD